MIYPNLTAECHFAGVRIDGLSHTAGIPPHLFQEVLIGKSKLESNEQYQIFRYMAIYGIKNFNYLFSPKLSMFDPSTRRNALKLHELERLHDCGVQLDKKVYQHYISVAAEANDIQYAEALSQIYQRIQKDREKAALVIRTAKLGPIPYAQYRYVSDRTCRCNGMTHEYLSLRSV